MLEELKEKVCQANLLLPQFALVTFTWGNVSEIDRERGIFAIKPSGIEYERLSPNDIVLVDLDGKIVEGKLNPSSDTKTHLELYRAFSKVGGIVHTHSTFATSFAQAGSDIPCFGTTHADYIYGSVPCLRNLTKAEIDEDYEKNSGKIIVEEFARRNLDCEAVPAALLKNHGPFAWGRSAEDAVHNAVVLEECAKMAFLTRLINPAAEQAPKIIQDKHYFRKHGAGAYYGQKK